MQAMELMQYFSSTAKIINCVNHDVKLFDSTAFYSNRQRNILKKGAIPYAIINRNKVVSIHHGSPIQIGDAIGVPIYRRNTEADRLEAYLNSDIILVSQYYATDAAALGYCCSDTTKSIHPLLLARLYIENKIYESETNDELVGAAGLIKTCRLTPQTYRFYINEYHAQRLPWEYFSLYNMAADMVQAETDCRTEAERRDIDFVKGFLFSAVQATNQQPATSLYY